MYGKTLDNMSSNNSTDLEHYGNSGCTRIPKPSTRKAFGQSKIALGSSNLRTEHIGFSDEKTTADNSPVTSPTHQQNALIVHAQPVMFTLKYLPRLMAEADVLEKLKLFGDVLFLRFMPETDIQGKKDWKSHFKRAEFAFLEKQAEISFQKVRRVRIKGLQVKIVQDELVGPVDQPADSCIWSYGLNNTKYFSEIQASVSSEVEMSLPKVKPTSKMYSSTINTNINNYRFNVRC